MSALVHVLPNTAFPMARYNEMCRAIDAAYEVDEVKDIRDKALAMQTYFRQAKNTEAERRACEVRLRAERKANELYDSQEKATGTRGQLDGRSSSGDPISRPPESDAPTLRELGVTKQQMHEWRQLRAVPDEVFEAALADPDVMPTAAGIIGKQKAQEPVEDDALWLWGRLLDFERRGMLTRNFHEVCRTMVPHMRETAQELAPKVSAWLRGEI